MQEIRSTSLLDIEIRENARRKAANIIKNAEVEAKKIEDGISARLSAFRDEKQRHFASLLTEYKRHSQASVPLEKARMKIDFEDAALRELCREFFDELSEDEKIGILRKKLASFESALRGQKVRITSNQFDAKTVSALVESAVGAQVVGVEEISTDEATRRDCRLGFLAQTADKSVLCRVTLSAVARGVLDERRAEMAASLFPTAAKDER